MGVGGSASVFPLNVELCLVLKIQSYRVHVLHSASYSTECLMFGVPRLCESVKRITNLVLG